jgi:hypothetical protein
VSAPCGRSMAVFDFVGTRCTLATRSAARLLHRASWLGHFHKTFGRSGHIKSHRSCRLCASRLGQSPLRCYSSQREKCPAKGGA